jgi:hypothetical protein
MLNVGEHVNSTCRVKHRFQSYEEKSGKMQKLEIGMLAKQ